MCLRVDRVKISRRHAWTPPAGGAGGPDADIANNIEALPR